MITPTKSVVKVPGKRYASKTENLWIVTVLLQLSIMGKKLWFHPPSSHNSKSLELCYCHAVRRRSSSLAGAVSEKAQQGVRTFISRSSEDETPHPKVSVKISRVK